jgi:hypothetical protein
MMQSLKHCTLLTHMAFPSVASGSSLPTSSRHIFSNDGLCAAKEGAASAMREKWVWQLVDELTERHTPSRAPILISVCDEAEYRVKLREIEAAGGLSGRRVIFIRTGVFIYLTLHLRRFRAFERQT